MDRGQPAPPTLEAALTARVEPLARRHVGLSVGALAGDERATIGVGRTGAGGEVPGSRTTFQIGSVTKVFTTLLLADAVHRGEVELEQPVSSLIPATATHPRGRAITLLDLATHASGLPRLPPGLWRQALRDRSDPYARFTVAQLEQALARRPKRPPTERARYSNYGAGVLGEALARAAGSTYGQLVATRIAGPLELRDTGVLADPSAGPVATGHTRRGSPTVDWQLGALAGAGALRSSAADLLTFLDAHLDPDRSPLGEVVRAITPPRKPAGRHLQVALGWFVLERRDAGPLWWHNGGTGGFRSFVGFDPSARAAVVVLSNTSRSVDRIGMTLLERREGHR